MSRREVLGASSGVLLGLLLCSADGGERNRGAADALPERMRRILETSETFSAEVLGRTTEQHAQMMRERTLARYQQAIDEIKRQLDVSDAEWQVVRPRLEPVYKLVHPMPQMSGAESAEASSCSDVEQKTQELRDVLAKKDADVDEIKAKLTVLRAAKEKANQELASARQRLRELMTVRQEALLVLNGLLE